MKVRGIIDSDFINYKKISMFIISPYCSFKCDKESGCKVCQNSEVVKLPIIDIPIDELIKRYDMFLLSKAVVLGGLEPLDSDDTHAFISAFRATHKDDIVIYTGYNKDEVVAKFRWIYDYPNIIIKYGRFIPNSKHRYDEVLGVELASDNQYAEHIGV